jgi:hypothetical protein
MKKDVWQVRIALLLFDSEDSNLSSQEEEDPIRRKPFSSL